MPLRRLPLSTDHQFLKLQRAREHRDWNAECRNVGFSDEFHFNISYNDGRIRARRYAGDRNRRACILQRHRGPTPSVMVWGAIGYYMRCRLLRIEDNLNSNRYIKEVLQPEVVPFLQATPHGIFQQDNAWPHVATIVQVFFQDDGYHYSLSCTFARHVAHRTCLGYGWSANCVEGHSPGRYPGPL